jgi:hypothetical protein
VRHDCLPPILAILGTLLPWDKGQEQKRGKDHEMHGPLHHVRATAAQSDRTSEKSDHEQHEILRLQAQDQRQGEHGRRQHHHRNREAYTRQGGAEGEVHAGAPATTDAEANNHPDPPRPLQYSLNRLGLAVRKILGEVGFRELMQRGANSGVFHLETR